VQLKEKALPSEQWKQSNIQTIQQWLTLFSN
jgi:hypothetical protein